MIFGLCKNAAGMFLFPLRFHRLFLPPLSSLALHNLFSSRYALGIGSREASRSNGNWIGVFFWPPLSPLTPSFICGRNIFPTSAPWPLFLHESKSRSLLPLPDSVATCHNPEWDSRSRDSRAGRRVHRARGRGRARPAPACRRFGRGSPSGQGRGGLHPATDPPRRRPKPSAHSAPSQFR